MIESKTTLNTGNVEIANHAPLQVALVGSPLASR